MRLVPLLYDAWMALAERARVAAWRHAVAGAARGRVVEIGAGTGLSFRHYAPSVLVVATDLDVAMLERARDRARESGARVLLVAADAGALPFRDGAFDEAVAMLVLCTVPDPARTLGELRRVVRAGGVVRLLEHVRAAGPGLVGRVQDWLTPVWRRAFGNCHLNRRTIEAVRGAGMLVESDEPYARGVVRVVVARVPA